MRYGAVMASDHRFAIRLGILAAVCALFAPMLAHAQQAPKQLGKFDTWFAYEAGPNNAKICYAIVRPSKSDSRPAGANRGDIVLMIAHHQNPRRNDEFTWTAGYSPRDGGEIEIGRAKIALSTLGQQNATGAWAKEADGDRQIVAALRSAPATANAVVKATSSRGTETVDTFPLAGFQKALAEIDKACGVRR
ncbi:MAG: hypothetical protein C6Y20_14675 [Tagaea sp. CACIAM 22H2]|jgi:hypothetical protein|nr:hypothetical protein [Tagaea sp. CACIAM 22H2]